MKRRELYVVSEYPEIGVLLDKCYELDRTTPWFRGRAEHLLKFRQAKDNMWDAIMDQHCKTTGLDTRIYIATREVRDLGMCFVITYEFDNL